MSWKKWIDKLQMKPHPEGGFYCETYRSEDSLQDLPPRFGGCTRSVATAICYLLAEGAYSSFHRIKSDEIWAHHDGGELLIHVLSPEGEYMKIVLGAEQEKSVPQAVVPHGSWFAAELVNPKHFALVGCFVAPGFDFADFEMGTKTDLLRTYPRHSGLIQRLSKE